MARPKKHQYASQRREANRLAVERHRWRKKHNISLKQWKIMGMPTQVKDAILGVVSALTASHNIITNGSMPWPPRLWITNTLQTNDNYYTSGSQNGESGSK
jgi:hypothetical protein